MAISSEAGQHGITVRDSPEQWWPEAVPIEPTSTVAVRIANPSTAHIVLPRQESLTTLPRKL